MEVIRITVLLKDLLLCWRIASSQNKSGPIQGNRSHIHSCLGKNSVQHKEQNCSLPFSWPLERKLIFCHSDPFLRHHLWYSLLFKSSHSFHLNLAGYLCHSSRIQPVMSSQTEDWFSPFDSKVPISIAHWLTLSVSTFMLSFRICL